MTPDTVALILGGASSLPEDVAAAEELVGGGPWPGPVVAVNNAGWWYPHPLAAWVTLHPEEFPAWAERRRLAGYDMGFDVWGGVWVTGRDDGKLAWVDHTLEVVHVASSGAHAVDVALGPLGCPGALLCGIPMDFRPHFDRPGPWDSTLMHRPEWPKAAAAWGDRVRSMSGWTAEFHGRPDPQWLNQEVSARE